MRLGLVWLRDVASVNAWQYSDQPDFWQNDAQTLYFQLVDESATGSTVAGLNPSFGFGAASPVTAVPRRYMPAAGATLTVVLDSIDDAKRVTRVLSQPFPLDASIWRLDITSADPVVGTVDLRGTLNEGGTIRSFRVDGALRIRSNARS